MSNYFDIFKPKNGEKTNLNVMKPKVGTTASVTTVTTVTEITTNSNLDLGDLTSGPVRPILEVRYVTLKLVVHFYYK